jgi:hypothetical protein
MITFVKFAHSIHDGLDEWLAVYLMRGSSGVVDYVWVRRYCRMRDWDGGWTKPHQAAAEYRYARYPFDSVVSRTWLSDTRTWYQDETHHVGRNLSFTIEQAIAAYDQFTSTRAILR